MPAVTAAVTAVDVVPVGVVPGPVRVVRVDVDEPLPSVSPWRDGGPDYVAAFVVVVRSGRPLGHVEVALDGRVLGPSQLRERLVAGLGDVWGSPVAGVVVADEALPSVTVVVPTTFERIDLLQRCVASLVAQDYPVFDVVVVDNRPEDSPRRLALWSRLSADGRVSVVAEPRPGSSAARNCGVGVARGEVVAFTDDDVEVESGWLRALGGRFAVEPQTDCVTGLVLPKELETPAQIWFERSGSKLESRYQLTHFRNDGASRRGFLGGLRRGRYQVTARRYGQPDETFFVYRGKFGMAANIAFRVAAFRALGGFDNALGAGIPTGGGEELQLLSRLVFSGRGLTFDPATAIYHAHRSDYEDLRKRMFGYGSGYSAMLVALVRTDGRHLIGLSWYALQAVRLMLQRSAGRRDSVYPKELSRSELRGLLRGPWTYLVSRRLMRRWQRSPGAPSLRPGAVT
jgi:glycosyltransferase involved in cell wall biosynthesis